MSVVKADPVILLNGGATNHPYVMEYIYDFATSVPQRVGILNRNMYSMNITRTRES